MERESMLAGGAIVVVAVALLVAATVPGALAEGQTTDEPSRLDVREQTIAAGAVSGGSATLRVDSRLRHVGGPAENVTVLLRAVDTETQMVATEQTSELRTIEDNREVSVVQNLSVPRNGEYRVRTIVFADGRRVASGTKTVSGVGALQPEYAQTGIEFHSFEGYGTSELPPIHFSIADTAGDEATLNVSAYLTNAGDEPNEALDVTLLARQADSNIVADKTVVGVGTVEPGRTASPSAELTVPDEYNYKLMAIAQKDDVIVDTAQATATLDPDQSVTVNNSEDEDTLDTSDFEDGADGGDGEADGREDGGEESETVSGSGPGFGFLVAVIALVASALLLRRNQ